MAGRTDSGQPETVFPADPADPAGAGARGYGQAPRMVPLMDPDTGLPFVDEFGVPAGSAPTGSPGSAPTGPPGPALTGSPGPAPTDTADPVPPGRPATPYWAAASEPMPDPAPVPKPEPEPVPEPQPDPGPQDLPPTAGIEAAEELLDTAERAVLTDALGVVDAGSRVTSPAAAGESAPDRPVAVRPGSRRVPAEDPDLTERRGPSFPGGPVLCAGLLAAACCGALLWWHGMLPDQVERLLKLPARDSSPLAPRDLALLVLGCAATLFALGGLARGRVGGAWVLSLFGRYRGTVRRTGLVWISPVLRRRRVDVRLRHWRSEPMPAVDAAGVQLRAVVLVVWRVVDAARARYAVDDHVTYLREQVEAGTARVLGRLPADAFHEDTPSLRDADAVGDALTAQLAADCRPVGIEVFSAQPTRIEYAPEVAAAMHRRQIAAIDARHRDTVLTSVVDAVDDTVRRLTTRGLVELDDYERKALVKDLTVAFYTARGSAAAQE